MLPIKARQCEKILRIFNEILETSLNFVKISSKKFLRFFSTAPDGKLFTPRSLTKEILLTILFCPISQCKNSSR